MSWFWMVLFSAQSEMSFREFSYLSDTDLVLWASSGV